MAVRREPEPSAKTTPARRIGSSITQRIEASETGFVKGNDPNPNAWGTVVAFSVTGGLKYSQGTAEARAGRDASRGVRRGDLQGDPRPRPELPACRTAVGAPAPRRAQPPPAPQNKPRGPDPPGESGTTSEPPRAHRAARPRAGQAVCESSRQDRGDDAQDRKNLGGPNADEPVILVRERPKNTGSRAPPLYPTPISVTLNPGGSYDPPRVSFLLSLSSVTLTRSHEREQTSPGPAPPPEPPGGSQDAPGGKGRGERAPAGRLPQTSPGISGRSGTRTHPTGRVPESQCRLVTATTPGTRSQAEQPLH